MMRALNSWSLVCLLTASFVLSPQPVGAHGLNPAGLSPFLVDGEMVGAATNLGLVFYVDGAPTWWTEMRVHGSLHWFGYTPTGRVLVGTSNTLLVTEDGGCSFEGHSEALGGLDIRVMSLNPETSRPHFFATATENVSNFIYMTPDGGDSWQALADTEISGQYLGLRYISATGNYLAMNSSETAGDYTFTVLDSAGQVIQSSTVPLEVVDDTRLITAGAAEGTAFVGSFTEDPDAEPVSLGTAIPGTDNLYLVDFTAGTTTIVETLTESNRFFSGAVFGGEVYITDFEDRYMRYASGGLVEVGEEVRYCIDDSLSLDVFWACGRRPQEHTFYSSIDGENWTGVLLFDDILVGECPDKVPGEPEEPGDGIDLSCGDNGADDDDGSSGENTGEISKGDLPGDTDDGFEGVENPTKPIDSSGCAATPLSLGWILGLVFLLRRRR